MSDPPVIRRALEYMELDVKRDAASPEVAALAKSITEGEFRPQGMARALALELARRILPERKGGPPPIEAAPDTLEIWSAVWFVDEDDWCVALGATLASLGVETKLVAKRGGEFGNSWTLRVSYCDGGEWFEALSADEAWAIVRAS